MMQFNWKGNKVSLHGDLSLERSLVTLKSIMKKVANKSSIGDQDQEPIVKEVAPANVSGLVINK